MLALWEPYGNFLHCLFTLPWSTCLLTSRLMHTGKAGLPSTTSSTSCYGFAPQACPLCLQPCGQWTGPTVSSLRSEWVNEYEAESTTVQSTGGGTRTSVTAVLLCVQWIKVYLCSQVSVCFFWAHMATFASSSKASIIWALEILLKIKIRVMDCWRSICFETFILKCLIFGVEYSQIEVFSCQINFKLTLWCSTTGLK